MVGSMLGRVCCLVLGGSVGISDGICLLLCNPIGSAVATGAAVAAAIVISGGATVVAADGAAVAAAADVVDGAAVAAAVVVVVADAKKLLLKILFCVFKSLSSFASSTLCSAAIAAAVFVIAAADVKIVSNSFSISLSICPTISSIVSSSVALSFTSTFDFGASSRFFISTLLILRSPLLCSTIFEVERKLWAASRCASRVRFFSVMFLLWDDVVLGFDVSFG